MARNKSAMKRDRQAKRRRQRNLGVKSSVKTAVKKVQRTLEAGDAEASQQALRGAVSLLHRAASKGVLHRKTASRKIARLSRKVQAASSS